MDNLSVFVERLNEYVTERNLNASSLAKIVGFSRVTVTNLLNGGHNPSTKIIIAFVDYFNCSADYLLGEKELTTDKRYDKFKPIGERLRLLLKQAHMSEYRFQQEFNISTSLSYRWLHNKALPNIDNLLKLSRFFGCTIDFILGREK